MPIPGELLMIELQVIKKQLLSNLFEIRFRKIFVKNCFTKIKRCRYQIVVLIIINMN